MTPQPKPKKPYSKDYYAANRDSFAVRFSDYYQRNKATIAERKKAYRQAHKAQIACEKKLYAERNKAKVAATQKAYRERTRKQRNAKSKERRKTDIQYRIKANLSTGFRRYLTGKRRTYSLSKILDYDKESLIRHLESRFQEGMTWENYGLKGWHVDHIKPLALFDLTDSKQAAEAYALDNLQPLWALDNIRKGDTYHFDTAH